MYVLFLIFMVLDLAFEISNPWSRILSVGFCIFGLRFLVYGLGLGLGFWFIYVFWFRIYDLSFHINRLSFSIFVLVFGLWI